VPYHSPKNDTQIFVVDYITPHVRMTCAKEGCLRHAIPLTGLCEVHDPLCAIMHASRIKAAIAKAEKEAAKAEVKDDAPSLDTFPGANDGDGRRLAMDDWYGGMH